MSLPLRIRLKNQFREPLETDIGFIGREDELARLITVFQRRRAATVLVAGHRGVGKSALVEEALQRSQADKKKRLVVHLTLPHLYSGGDDLRDQILRSLARGLYFSLKDRKDVPALLRDRGKGLYDKTYLKSLEEHTLVESLVEAEARAKSATRTTTTVEPGKIVSVIIGTALSAGVAIGGISVVSRIINEQGSWWGLLAGTAIVAIAVLSGIKLLSESAVETTIGAAITASHKLGRTGLYDVSPETLEFELRDLIEQLTDKGCPCVFVIDELDKLEASTMEQPAHFEDHVIFRIVSSLKNFFTLGSGIYVFISGENFYARLSEPGETGLYSLAHTLFTDRIFVHVLYYRAVERLIDQLLAEEPVDTETYRRFRNYLGWQSRNHVFDLLSLIGEYVVFDDQGRPVLIAAESSVQDGHWREGNLPDNWQTAAALQKFVGAAYDESLRPSAGEQRFNQALWLTLLRTAYDLFARQAVKAPEAGYEVSTTYDWMQNLTRNDLDDLSGAVDRLLAKLERYGAVRLSQEAHPAEIEGQPEITLTSYSLVDNPPYPPTSVGAEVERIPFENSFLDLARNVNHLAGNLAALNIDTAPFSEEINTVSTLAQGVENISPRSTVPRSKVRDGIKRADVLAEQLVEAGVSSVITNWATSHEMQVSKSVAETENRTGAPWQDSLVGEFSDLVGALNSTEIEYFIIGGSISENQLMVVNDRGDKDLRPVSEAYAKALPGEKGRDRRKQRFPIIVVSHLPSGETPQIPQEVIEVIRENAGRSFLSFMLGSVTRTRGRQTLDLAGWQVFALDPSLDNLGDLTDFMDKVSYVPS